jgi:hypothetical protein
MIATPVIHTVLLLVLIWLLVDIRRTLHQITAILIARDAKDDPL